MRIVVAGIVALLAAGYFAIGIRWALGWPLGWIDSGLVVYGAWRVTNGALPYRDFDHVYGPSLFYVNAALFRMFGTDLSVTVTSILVLKAILAALVFSLARRVATPTVAVVGLLPDASKRCGMAFRQAGDVVAVLGTTKGELGGSEWLHAFFGKTAGRPPRLDEKAEVALQQKSRSQETLRRVKFVLDEYRGGSDREPLGD